jgi:acyl-CoA thioesterase YciA
MTKDIGVSGNLFGGKMLAALDEAVASFATIYCRTPNMVTLKVDEVVFKEPIKVQNLVRIYCEVVGVGTTSIRIKAEARKVSYYTEQERVVCSTIFTFVRIDEDGHPVPIADHVRKRFNTDQPVPESKI